VSIGQHQILIGDTIEVMRGLPAGHFHTCVTSPPYWGLRDYGVDGQIGLEGSPDAFVAKMVDVFREVRRVLRDDGTCWVNLGDSYASGYAAGSNAPSEKSTLTTNNGKGPRVGDKYCADKAVQSRRVDIGNLKPKDLCGIPWRVALALQADGWWLRSDIIWHKPAPMPESVTDRPTRAHEYIFLLTKAERYFYDAEAVKEEAAATYQCASQKFKEGDLSTHHRSSGSGDVRVEGGTRNRRTVWTVASEPFPGLHFATYPTKLIEPCIKAGSSERGCCPECGAPWRRMVERSKAFASGSGRSGNAIVGKQDLAAVETNSTPDIRMGPVVESRTTGWEPTCDHGLASVPCRVLDPFSGSGTTAGVACRLGRDAVGIELNPKYAAMSEDRIAAMTRPTTARTDEVGDSPLFAEAHP
jgi:DNA modification methylase